MKLTMEKNRFLDEKIIRVLDQVENPIDEIAMANDAEQTAEKDNRESEKHTIYTGLKIKGQWFDFAEHLYANDKITMMTPTSFIPMSIETAKLKYPSEQRPETILTDNTGAINIMFNYMNDEPMDNKQSEAVRDTLMGIMCRMNPGIKPLERGMEVISDKNIAFVEFSNPAIDGKLYNLMFFFELSGSIAFPLNIESFHPFGGHDIRQA